MKKIFQSLLVLALISLIADKVNAQSQNNNSKLTVTFIPVNAAPAASDTATVSSNDNTNTTQTASGEAQSLWAPEHPGNKTREEVEKTVGENKKKESVPKK